MPVDKWSDQVSIVHLSTDPEFTEDMASIETAFRQHPVHVVLDFSGVQYVTSSNISRLLKLRKVLADTQQRLVLCGINTKVWGTFLATGLDKVFEVSEIVPTALATLQIS